MTTQPTELTETERETWRLTDQEQLDAHEAMQEGEWQWFGWLYEQKLARILAARRAVWEELAYERGQLDGYERGLMDPGSWWMRSRAADRAVWAKPLQALADEWEARYAALRIAAGNTADDAERYFLAWQSARRRANRATPEQAMVCGSCGGPAMHVITLHNKPVPTCLRHLNHWRTPADNYTCPTVCVERNHPGREHLDWLAADNNEDADPWHGDAPCPCQSCTAVRPVVDTEHNPAEEVERVARAICDSVIAGNVLGGTYTEWTDWRPEAKAAISAMRTPGGGTPTEDQR